MQGEERQFLGEPPKFDHTGFDERSSATFGSFGSGRNRWDAGAGSFFWGAAWNAAGEETFQPQKMLFESVPHEPGNQKRNGQVQGEAEDAR